jgi:hypothetical protein
MVRLILAWILEVTMEYTRITVQEEENIIMGFNRPERKNAFDVEMYEESPHAYGDDFTSCLEVDKRAPVQGVMSQVHRTASVLWSSMKMLMKDWHPF